jgi:predicted DCC family thiol-disulfide oxidoreductase YuxK
MLTTGAAQIKGWVLYDGACGFCSRWAPLWERALAKRGFLIAPLQSDWVAEKLHLSDKELASDFRLLLVDGEQLAGAAAYRYLMRRIGWATPLYLLSILPGLRTLFDTSYRAFAENRYWISRRCHVPLRSGKKR